MKNVIKKILAMGIITFMFLSIIFVNTPVVNASSTTYYIDSVSGNDSNSGKSSSTPWKTLDKVNSTTFEPGDQILLKRGQTFNGMCWPKGSGSSGLPITLGAYGTGNRPIISGSTNVTNYVSNPGFESGSSSWNLYGSSSVVSTSVYAGSYCVEAVGTNACVYRTITGLKPNTTYTLEARGKITNSSQIAFMYAKNFGGTEVHSSQLGYDEKGVYQNANYNGISLIFTTGATNTSVEIGVWKSSGADRIYVDEFSLMERSPAVQLLNQEYWSIQDIETTGGTPYGIAVRNTVSNTVLDYIRITNCVSHHVAGTSVMDKTEGCISVSTDGAHPGAQFNDVVIDSCTAYSTQRWSGIIVFGYYNDASRSTNITIKNSTVYDTYGDGIAEFCTSNALITDCVSYDVGKMPKNIMGTPNGIWQFCTNNGIVQNCEAYNTHSPQNDGGAYDIDVWNNNCTVQYNYGHDNDAYGVAVFAAPDSYGNRGITTNSIVRYNVFSNNGRAIPVLGSDGCDQGDIYVFTWGGGIFNGIQIYNNTSYWNPVQNYAAVKATNCNFTGTNPNFIKNNIIYSTVSKLIETDSNNISFDNNLYWCLNGISPSWTYNKINYTNFSAYKAGSGQDAHGMYTNPLFVYGTTKLSSSSPAINAGTNVGNMGSRDFYGTAIPRSSSYDIGAYEY